MPSINRDRIRYPADDQVIDLRDSEHPTQRKRRRKKQTGPRRVEPADLAGHAQLRHSKLFGSPAFRRLWLAQVASSLGDWIGFVAITTIATNLGGTAAGLGAVSLVLSARLFPGIFFAPFAGVITDRYNRKVVMVVCDVGRAVVLCLLPLVDNLLGLFVASLLLELMTLLWAPAKEASVPKMVRPDFLPTANSLSLAAAYGTFPVAAAVFAIISKVPAWLSERDIIDINITKEALALYVDAGTYLISALVIATLAIDHQRKVHRPKDQSRVVAGLKEALEGLIYVLTNVRVRSVIAGLGTGLIGGGMLVPLGPTFARDVLDAGNSGYGLLLAAMGTGVAIGVLAVSVLQKRLPIDRAFVVAAIGAGVALLVAASMNGLGAAVIAVGVLGLFAGAVYVLGFTIVQVNTVDEMRGRVFAALFTMSRICIIISFVLAPLLSIGLDSLSSHLLGHSIEIIDWNIALPGVRITLWLAGAIIVVAGVLASHLLTRPPRSDPASSPDSSPTSAAQS